MNNKMKLVNKILISCIFLASLLTGCQHSLWESDGAGGNVTVTVRTGDTARTLYPTGISAVSVFERIEVVFSKDNLSTTLTIPKGTSSGSINLGNGTWNISAKGFILIGEQEYEAAQANTFCVVNGATNVTIDLQTGILSGSPGVFSYNVSFPNTVSEAILDINTLYDPFGNNNSVTGKTVLLKLSPSGSFELLPGYYLLNITAKDGNKMAVWNEIVHIYSGQQTSVEQTFVTGDFIGTVGISGALLGGELDGEHLSKVNLIAYGDENYLTRVANVEVTLSKGEQWYTGDWAITVPSSLVGKMLYLIADETLVGGPAGTRNFIRRLGSDNHITVLAEGITGHDIGLEYYWWTATSELSSDSITRTVDGFGVINVTTSQPTETDWQLWWHTLGLSYPAEVNNTYAYEFEAWTDSGSRKIRVLYINKWDWDQSQFYEDFIIDTTRKTYTIVSKIPFDSHTAQYFQIQCGSVETGSFNIKMNSIKRTQDYIPPQPSGGRWSATATANGILFTVDMNNFPSYIENKLVIRNLTNGVVYAVEDLPNPLPAEYQVIFPYVATGKEYTFSIGSWNYPLAENITITATGGKGDLGFSNASSLLLLNDGNNVNFNKTPTLSVTEANAVNARYTYEFATGTSWSDPTAQWQISVDKTYPNEIVNLLDWTGFPDWANPADILSSLADKTCFASVFYTFDYNNNDIYPTNSKHGFFRTDSIVSAPFTYPKIIPNSFAAVQDAKGVKFTVDLTKIPPGTTQLQFHSPSWDMQCFVGSWEWENTYGPFYGETQINIIYPFVNTGTTYQFIVNFEGTGTTAEATVTPYAGLGEVKYSNSSVSLLYNSTTKTMTFQGQPNLFVNDPNNKITKQGWEWQFYKGHGWNSDNSWAGAVLYGNDISSVVFDNTFTEKGITNKLSTQIAFIQVIYFVEYDGHDYLFGGTTSPWFVFPSFEPYGAAGTPIISAFNTNEALSLGYWIQDNNLLHVQIEDWNWYADGWDPGRYYWFQIGENIKIEGEQNQADIDISGLSPGRYYGLAVISIDGAVFAKEFEFWK